MTDSMSRTGDLLRLPYLLGPQSGFIVNLQPFIPRRQLRVVCRSSFVESLNHLAGDPTTSGPLSLNNLIKNFIQQVVVFAAVVVHRLRVVVEVLQFLIVKRTQFHQQAAV